MILFSFFNLDKIRGIVKFNVFFLKQIVEGATRGNNANNGDQQVT